jgi:Rod binding domain-containing protein
MTDAIPAIADPTLTGVGAPAIAMKMGPGGNIDKTANDFEAMFATQMLQPMFEGISADPTFGGGHGEEMMRSFMLQEYGKLIAKSGRLGIAAQVKSEMLRAQEGYGGRGASRSAKTPYGKASNPGLSQKSRSSAIARSRNIPICSGINKGWRWIIAPT